MKQKCCWTFEIEVALSSHVLSILRISKLCANETRVSKWDETRVWEWDKTSVQFISLNSSYLSVRFVQTLSENNVSFLPEKKNKMECFTLKRHIFLKCSLAQCCIPRCVVFCLTMVIFYLDKLMAKRQFSYFNSFERIKQANERNRGEIKNYTHATRNQNLKIRFKYWQQSTRLASMLLATINLNIDTDFIQTI